MGVLQSTEKLQGAGNGAALAQAARDLGKKLESAGTRVLDGADVAVSSTGDGMVGLAGALRSPIASGVERAADGLENGGKYLKRKRARGLAENAGAFLKRHPLPVIAVAFGAGLLLARRARG